ncbi:FAD-dependent oxidoreductase [Streptomyces sp. NPDC004749]
MVDSAGAGTGTTASRDGAHHSSGRRGRHALVVGGGPAALLTARVLASHADRVTLVERDRLPDGPEPRAGVPQSRHNHVLLEGGQRALEKLLPGIVGELREHGAPRVGMPDDLVQWQDHHFYRRTPATAHLLTGSRPLLEWLVRRRVLADPRITVVEGTEVVGLVGDAARVRGVRVRERGAGTHQDVRELTADLVVDASGRGSRAPEWLAAIGADVPHEETIDAGLAYATRMYRGPADRPGAPGPSAPAGTRHATDPAGAGGTPGAPAAADTSDTDSTPGEPGTDGGGDPDAVDCVGYYFVPGRDEARGAVVLPIEGGRYLVTLSGLRGSEPPADETEFTDFAARLPHPLVHDWLLKAEPESAVHAFRSTSDIRRRYDRPGRRPAGFLATGDALCCVNPVYGQGLTVAAFGALALRDALADPRRTPTTRRVQRALSRAARQAWDIASGADRVLPGARGDAVRLRPADRPAAWYLGRVRRRAPGDPVVGAAFRSVLALKEPGSVLFAPRVARAVLFGPVRPAPTEPQARRE